MNFQLGSYCCYIHYPPTSIHEREIEEEEECYPLVLCMNKLAQKIEKQGFFGHIILAA